MSPTIATYMLGLAASQHGVVSASQIRAHATRAQARALLSSPQWTRESSLVFGVTGAPRTPRYVAMARLLRAGPGAVVSHHSALWLWGVRTESTEPFHISRMRAANGSKLRTEGIAPHETRKMPPTHVTTLDGFPVVTPARALADVAATTPLGRVERWLDRAWTMRLVDYQSLHAVLVDLQKPGRRGVKPLGILLEGRGPDYVAPESGLEGRLNHILARAGLPGVRRQVEVGGERWLGRVDFVLGSSSIVIEVQSDTYHWALTSRRDDELRAQRIAKAGFQIMPVWESAIWSDPKSVVASIQTAMREDRR